MSDIKDRLLAACNGHPNALIPWPHRLLHDAIDQIEAQQEKIAAMERRKLEPADTLADWLDSLPSDERDVVCLADAWNYQQARIEELEAGIRKSVRLFDENPYYTPEIMLELDALLPESGE